MIYQKKYLKMMQNDKIAINSLVTRD